MNNLIYYILAFVAGFGLTMQAGVNSQLRATLGNPVLAAMVSFLIGTFSLLIYILIFERNNLGVLNNLRGMQWHKWTGGLIGAFFVTGVVIFAPRIGAANTACLIIAGQVLFALFLDHYGYLGFTQHTFNLLRFAGAVLVISGVFLILRN